MIIGYIRYVKKQEEESMKKILKKAMAMIVCTSLIMGNIIIDRYEIKAEEKNIEVKELELGWYDSSAITENGDLYCWGANVYDLHGAYSKQISTVSIKVLSKVKKVELGDNHRAAILENGDLYCWGDNVDGQLGDGTTTYSIIPIKILSGVKEVSLGQHHCAAILENGDLYCWGYNGVGQLGNGTTTRCSTPTKILSGVKEVSLGSSHSAAILENGDLYCWGGNYNGQLGTGKTAHRSTPVKIMSGVKEVSLGGGHSAAILENGDLYSWGWNTHGELGDGTTTDSSTPVKIMSGVKEVALGYTHSAAILENGDLYFWGENNSGQLGCGSLINHTIPFLIETIRPVGNILCSNTLTKNQEITLQMYDNNEVKGIYWGNSVFIKKNPYYSFPMDTKRNISESGTYYLLVEDICGNMSDIVSITLNKVILDGNGADLDINEVLIQNGKSITMPAPKWNGYKFKGWSTDKEAKTGTEEIYVTADEIYYAIWEEINESSTTINEPIVTKKAGKAVKVSKIKFATKTKTLKVSKKIKLKLKITPANATNKKVTWKSSNKKYATVSNSGVVKAKKAGKGKNVIITAKAKDGSGKKAKIKIKIK